MKLQMFTVATTITMPSGAIHDYTATVPAQDADHARSTTAYAIAAVWPGSSHIIESVEQLSDEEVARIRVQLSLFLPHDQLRRRL